MNLIITASAGDDIIAGYNFYEKQETGLGGYFRDVLFAEIDALRLDAGIHPRVHGKHRRLIRTFPYAVFYDINEETVIVSAVLDCRSNPSWIRNKLKLE